MLLQVCILTALFRAVFSFDHPRVKCTTTKGPIVIEVYRDWAPLGADRFLELVKDGFYTDIAFYRCVRGFLTQFGISEDKSKKHWHRNQIQDDPNLHLGIKKNYVSYAGGGPNTRSTQLFIAFEDLDFLGKEPWETPFGRLHLNANNYSCV
jgi:peptidyl-prolyl cis-trans isomerase A (cyclophilin A)